MLKKGYAITSNDFTVKIANQIKIPLFNKFGCKFEVNEMFIKQVNGKSQNWLNYAIEEKTKIVIGFVFWD